MSGSSRGSRYVVFITLFVLVASTIPLVIWSRKLSQGQVVVPKSDPAIEALRRRGAMVFFKQSGKRDVPPDVLSVDLSRTKVNAELLQNLTQFPRMERLTLDGAQLAAEDYALLGKLPQLQDLSLSHSSITDNGATRLPLGLTTLSLQGTAVTDKSLAHVAAMKGLATLDIANTDITSDGLKLLEPLRSLQKLSLDDSCITAETVESLRLMQPQKIDVAVSDGMGEKAFELLSVCEGMDIRGYHRDGFVLWKADLPWSHTLAGVFEAVVAEVELDPQQAAQLLTILGKELAPEAWRPETPVPLPSPGTFGFTTNRPDQGVDFKSTDEFIRHLQNDLFKMDVYAVRRFAREKFSARDVPKLLAAIRGAQYAERSGLFSYGPFLLVQHGIEDPDVAAELDRMLMQREFPVRLTTMFAFAYGGASPLYARDEWVPSPAADAFAAPRLLRVCRDEGESAEIRASARMVLTEIALRRPEYAAEVLTLQVAQLENSASTSDLIARLAEVDPGAAVAAVPRIRALLKKYDEQLASVPAPAASADGSNVYVALPAPHRHRLKVLEALSACAHGDPALAHEIALEYLSRREKGQPSGPFATLLSPETPEANRLVVRALLREAAAQQYPHGHAKAELASLAKKIRDWREPQKHRDE